jgi:hypothetical protein
VAGALPADYWLSERPAEREAARLACTTCPVLESCRSWSLSLPSGDGAVYGGLTVRERLRLKAEAGLPPAGMARRNAAKTHCDHGHPLSGVNLVMVTDPRDGRAYRQCRECRRDRKRVSARLRSQRDRQAAA